MLIESDRAQRHRLVCRRLYHALPPINTWRKSGSQTGIHMGWICVRRRHMGVVLYA
jgi:hypothetical protein